jgi:predicted RNase H-like nuclease (RuvC/YqgF family)
MLCLFRLYDEEKAHKAEMAQLKLRYDGRVAVISEEIQGLQGQVSRFKRERDTFRHMLEGAQRTIADLKASSGRESRSSGSNVDEVKANNLLFFPKIKFKFCFNVQ